MKRSKLFLALTTGTLAVVGLFAAKASRFVKPTPWFYTQAQNKICTSLGTAGPCTYDNTVTTPQCTISLGGVSVQLYTTFKAASHDCKTKLFYSNL